MFIGPRILLAPFRLRSLWRWLTASPSRTVPPGSGCIEVAEPVTPARLDVLQRPQLSSADTPTLQEQPLSAPPITAHAALDDPQPIDEAAIRAEVVEFLDQAEARARRRPDRASGLALEQLSQQDQELAQLAETRERFSREFEQERDAKGRDARSALEQAEAVAERRLEEARAEAGHLLERARTDACELVRRAQGEAEQTLEWSRAQGAEIVRRSQRVAAERFTNDPRPWFAVDPGQR